MGASTCDEYEDYIKLDDVTIPDTNLMNGNPSTDISNPRPYVPATTGKTSPVQEAQLVTLAEPEVERQPVHANPIYDLPERVLTTNVVTITSTTAISKTAPGDPAIIKPTPLPRHANKGCIPSPKPWRKLPPTSSTSSHRVPALGTSHHVESSECSGSCADEEEEEEEEGPSAGRANAVTTKMAALTSSVSSRTGPGPSIPKPQRTPVLRKKKPVVAVVAVAGRGRAHLVQDSSDLSSTESSDDDPRIKAKVKVSRRKVTSKGIGTKVTARVDSAHSGRQLPATSPGPGASPSASPSPSSSPRLPPHRLPHAGPAPTLTQQPPSSPRSLSSTKSNSNWRVSKSAALLRHPLRFAEGSVCALTLSESDSSTDTETLHSGAHTGGGGETRTGRGFGDGSRATGAAGIVRRAGAIDSPVPQRRLVQTQEAGYKHRQTQPQDGSRLLNRAGGVSTSQEEEVVAVLGAQAQAQSPSPKHKIGSPSPKRALPVTPRASPVQSPRLAQRGRVIPGSPEHSGVIHQKGSARAGQPAMGTASSSHPQPPGTPGSPRRALPPTPGTHTPMPGYLRSPAQSPQFPRKAVSTRPKTGMTTFKPSPLKSASDSVSVGTSGGGLVSPVQKSPGTTRQPLGQYNKPGSQAAAGNGSGPCSPSRSRAGTPTSSRGTTPERDIQGARSSSSKSTSPKRVMLKSKIVLTNENAKPRPPPRGQSKLSSAASFVALTGPQSQVSKSGREMVEESESENLSLARRGLVQPTTKPVPLRQMSDPVKGSKCHDKPSRLQKGTGIASPRLPIRSLSSSTSKTDSTRASRSDLSKRSEQMEAVRKVAARSPASRTMVSSNTRPTSAERKNSVTNIKPRGNTQKTELRSPTRISGKKDKKQDLASSRKDLMSSRSDIRSSRSDLRSPKIERKSSREEIKSPKLHLRTPSDFKTSQRDIRAGKSDISSSRSNLSSKAENKLQEKMVTSRLQNVISRKNSPVPKGPIKPTMPLSHVSSTSSDKASEEDMDKKSSKQTMNNMMKTLPSRPTPFKNITSTSPKETSVKVPMNNSDFQSKLRKPYGGYTNYKTRFAFQKTASTSEEPTDQQNLPEESEASEDPFSTCYDSEEILVIECTPGCSKPVITQHPISMFEKSDTEKIPPLKVKPPGNKNNGTPEKDQSQDCSRSASGEAVTDISENMSNSAFDSGINSESSEESMQNFSMDDSKIGKQDTLQCSLTSKTEHPCENAKQCKSSSILENFKKTISSGDVLDESAELLEEKTDCDSNITTQVDTEGSLATSEIEFEAGLGRKMQSKCSNYVVLGSAKFTDLEGGADGLADDASIRRGRSLDSRLFMSNQILGNIPRFSEKSNVSERGGVAEQCASENASKIEQRDSLPKTKSEETLQMEEYINNLEDAQLECFTSTSTITPDVALSDDNPDLEVGEAGYVKMHADHPVHESNLGAEGTDYSGVLTTRDVSGRDQIAVSQTVVRRNKLKQSSQDSACSTDSATSGVNLEGNLAKRPTSLDGSVQIKVRLTSSSSQSTSSDGPSPMTTKGKPVFFVTSDEYEFICDDMLEKIESRIIKDSSSDSTEDDSISGAKDFHKVGSVVSPSLFSHLGSSASNSTVGFPTRSLSSPDLEQKTDPERRFSQSVTCSFLETDCSLKRSLATSDLLLDQSPVASCGEAGDCIMMKETAVSDSSLHTEAADFAQGEDLNLLDIEQCQSEKASSILNSPALQSEPISKDDLRRDVSSSSSSSSSSHDVFDEPETVDAKEASSSSVFQQTNKGDSASETAAIGALADKSSPEVKQLDVKSQSRASNNIKMLSARFESGIANDSWKLPVKSRLPRIQPKPSGSSTGSAGTPRSSSSVEDQPGACAAISNAQVVEDRRGGNGGALTAGSGVRVAAAGGSTVQAVIVDTVSHHFLRDTPKSPRIDEGYGTLQSSAKKDQSLRAVNRSDPTLTHT